MKFKYWLIDFGIFLVRIIIIGSLLFGPAIIATLLQNEDYLYLYLVSALISATIFLKR